MKNLEKGQRGFTLIELLIAIVLAGIITGGITATISQVLTINVRATNHMAAVRQVQQAGKLVSEDAQMAQNVTPGGSSGFPLTLTWIEWETNDPHEVIYTLEDMTGGLKKLQREHYINSDLDSTIKVAEYIDPDQTSCYPEPEDADPEDVERLTFTVTATVGGQSETRVYEIEPRPD